MRKQMEGREKQEIKTRNTTTDQAAFIAELEFVFGVNPKPREILPRLLSDCSEFHLLPRDGDARGALPYHVPLLVHCSPQEHLNFKVSMFEKNDMDHVGGELGAVPDANKSLHLSFLSAKLGSMVTKMDTEFEARPEKSRRIDGRFVLDCVGLMLPHVSTCSSCSKMLATCVGDVFFFTCRSMDSAPSTAEVPGTWLMLGGSEAAAAYLTSKTVDEGIGASLLSTSCSDVQEQEADT